MASSSYQFNNNNPITTHSSEEEATMPQNEQQEERVFKELIHKIKPNKYATVKPKKFNYAKFDIHSAEYNLERILTNNKKNKTNNKLTFIDRMENDVKHRHSKESVREQMLSKHKLKKTEAERQSAFNRLIVDSNRRLEVNQNMKELDHHLTNLNFPIEKMPIDKWNNIYQKRFITFKNKHDEKQEKKIIQKEKEIKHQEDQVVQCINTHARKVSRDEINVIVDRLCIQATRKSSKGLSTASTNKDDNIPNHMKHSKKNTNLKMNLKKRNELNIISSPIQSRRMWEVKKNTTQHTSIHKTIIKTPKTKSIRETMSTSQKKKKEEDDMKSNLESIFDQCDCNNYIKTNYLNFTNRTKTIDSNGDYKHERLDSYQSALTKTNNNSPWKTRHLTTSIHEQSKKKSFITPLLANRIVDSLFTHINKTIE